ncbi:glycosyltransferase family 2 protein [Butyrivibrio sp. VCD2006]|uniref:glycosyltransferase family 2 protein n=1 Tax=Butyrivibrio sp. VCD2006 TaxID=1280664 RepID=UPI0009DBD3F3|nr:glycosyltransferase family 2 protein [Butyrivibrio sp. VCD2006]
MISENKPLVSIMIPNYNYSRYLDQCIKSALDQTYENLEIVILDNTSTDDSVKIAAKYLSDKRVRVCRNQFNILSRSYNVLSKLLTNGKYRMMLCSDDFIYPHFVEQAVEIMEKYPNVGYVHGEKDFITEDGKLQYWDPFYKCSFVAPGLNTMPVYMVTTVAHPSQGIFRSSSFFEIRGYDKEIDHMNGDKTLWFYLSEVSDAAYIKEKCCGIRLGSETQTFITQRNFQHPILCHLTIKDFVKYAKEKGYPQVYNRENEAMLRLADEFVGYAIGMLAEKDFALARDYLIYAKIVSREICKSEKYIISNNMLATEVVDKEVLAKLVTPPEKKKRGYEPPEGYTELVKGIDYGQTC